MLTLKNTYALLLIFSTQLGCSLSNRYHMDQGGEKSGNPTSSATSPECEHKDDNDLEVMSNKVSNLLATNNFQVGSPLNDDEINLIIKELGRDISYFNIDSFKKGYKEFLNHFGCIYGKGFEISGPTKSLIDSQRKVEYITSMQRGFENRCRINGLKPTEIQSSWLIAETDQMNNHEGKQYYLNISNTGKGLIYAMNLDGTSDFFAEDFLDFLDKFLAEYKTSTKTKIYQQGMEK